MTLHHGDSLLVLKSLESSSIDSLITDPPAGISFMGKEWDDDKGGRDAWIAWMKEVMQECLRVLKPGAHGLVWAIPRTSHWTATALEDAGFEVRDVITHIFGSGFPKSLDISKAIDKAAGAEREVVGHKGEFDARYNSPLTDIRGGNYCNGEKAKLDLGAITAPSTPEAKQWQGFGTALKPASEHWILVRKPLSEKTVASNVLKHGTGGINIDASRIQGAKPSVPQRDMKTIHGGQFGAGDGKGRTDIMSDNTQGRFPANLVLSHNEDCGEEVPFPHADFMVWKCVPGCAVAMLDAQSGNLLGAGNKSFKKTSEDNYSGGLGGFGEFGFKYDNGGRASRFFYCAKASKSDKGSDNTHPTVKSTKLMSYLIKLITPPNGVVLDPFMGSGSTGVAAVGEGFKFIGIEMEQDYIEITTKRITHVKEATCHKIKIRQEHSN